VGDGGEQFLKAGGVGVDIISIKEEGGAGGGGVGWGGGGGGDVEREKVRRAWSARGRRDIEKCWICGRRSWLAKT
jgi:hypothetical protein